MDSCVDPGGLEGEETITQCAVESVNTLIDDSLETTHGCFAAEEWYPRRTQITRHRCLPLSHSGRSHSSALPLRLLSAAMTVVYSRPLTSHVVHNRSLFNASE
jgi:hypothetical protein